MPVQIPRCLSLVRIRLHSKVSHHTQSQTTDYLVTLSAL